MLYKISDQPFLRFDQHLDIPGLLDLKEELCHAFTEAWLGLGKGNQALPSVAGHPANWPNSNSNVEEVYLPHYEGQELAGALHQTLKDQSAPGHARVKSFVENGHIFSEIGRVVVFFNDQHQFCLVHRDHNQFNVVENPDEFVWFNVFPDRKRFYVLDGETGEKHYFDNHAIWFDTANWHGSDPCAFAAFTIRVDGVFTKTWRKKIGYKPKVTEEKKVPKKPSKSKNMWSQAKD